MAQQPYNPVPQVAQQLAATPSLHINAVPDAFGAGVAHALGNVGGALEKASGEIFNRATALQELDNQASARDAATDYIIKTGELHAQYSSLEGKAAVEAYPKYIADLKQTREDIRAGLSNPMVQKLYDSESQSTMGRTIFNGAGHAASQNRQYLVKSSLARIDAAGNQVLTNPQDERGFQLALDAAKEQTALLGGYAGEDAGQIALAQNKEVSKLWSQRLLGLSRTSPDEAKTKMEELREKGTLLGQDYLKISPHIDTILHSVTARNASEAVNTGWAPYVTKSQMDRADGVEQSLTDVIKRAQQNHPELEFIIGGQGGKRSQAEQDKLYAQGRTAPGPVVTWTRNSEHLSGRAVDLAGLDGATKPEAVRAAMTEAAQQLGVTLADKPGLAAKDPGHFELARDFNTGKYEPPEPTSLASRQKAAEDYVAKKYNDPKMTYATQDRVRTDWNLEQTAQRKEQADTLSSLKGYIYDNKIVNKDIIVNTPSLAEAYNKLSPENRKRMDNAILSNAKEPTQNTPERQVNAQRLLSMSLASSGKIKEFMDIDAADLMNKGLISTTGMTQINSAQRAITKGEERDAKHIGHAMSVSKEYLKANNIISGSDDELMFRGQMNQWLMDYVAEKKTTPKDSEIADKAQELVTASGGGWFGIGATYGYEVPKEFEEKIKPLLQKRNGGNVPGKEAIARSYQAAKKNPEWLRTFLETK